MTVLGTITHEAGNLSEWSSTAVDTGNSVTANGTSALTGSFGAEVVLTTVTAFGGALLVKAVTFPGSGVESIRFQFKIASRSGGGAWYILDTHDGAATFQYNIVRVIENGGTWSLRSKRRDGGSEQSSNFSTTPSVGTTYHMEIVYDSGAQTVTCYLDDVQVAQNVDPSVTGTTMEVTEWQLGAEQSGGSPLVDLYVDTVQWGDALIGGGGGGATTVGHRTAGNSRLTRQAVTW